MLTSSKIVQFQFFKINCNHFFTLGATTVRRARSVAEISLGGRYNQQHPQGNTCY